MSSATGGQYAFVIETRGNLDRWWSWISEDGNTEGVAAGRGVEDDAPGDPRHFARATLDAYLDHLVAASPTMALESQLRHQPQTSRRSRARRCGGLFVVLSQHPHDGGGRGVLAPLRAGGDDEALGDVAQAHLLVA